MQKVVIGDATLYHGDALEVLPELTAVDFVFTDPPYGQDNGNNRAQLKKTIMNDDLETANLLYRGALGHFNRILPPGGVACCCCSGSKGLIIADWLKWMDELLGLETFIVWDKGIGFSWRYRRAFDLVLIGVKAGQPMRWYDTSNKVETVIRPHKIRKIIPNNDTHNTPKPLELVQHFIRLHTQEGDVVLDTFMGGGTSGVAALRLGRKFIGIELDERYFEMSCKRIEQEYNKLTIF